MKIGKKTAVAKEITRQERNRRNNLKRITISLIVAFILFISLTVIQSSILNQEEKKPVYQVVKDIPVGTKLTEDNIGSYLSLKEVQISLIPENFIVDKTVLLDKFTNREYKAKDIITEDGILDTERLYLENIENPVEVSFSTESLATAVSGVVREGDYVNIYGMRRPSNANTFGSMSENLYEVDQTYTFKHVYITKAFDGSGNRIETAELESLTGGRISTTMFSIILDEKDAELFNEMLKNCEIRIAKLMYNTEQDYKDFLTETNKQAAEATVTTGQAEQSAQSGKTLEETGYFWENTPNYAEEALAAQEIQPGDTDPVDYTTEVEQELAEESTEEETAETTEEVSDVSADDMMDILNQ